MKKFNLFKEIIVADKSLLLQAVNSAKLFGIDINGQIKNEPFDDNDILIYQGQADNIKLNKNYQVVEDGDRILIKAFANWQELIGVNTPKASYDDTTGDGILGFTNDELENIGWHATDFDIDYRTLVEVLEEECEGTILCIEQEEPFQFSGLGFLNDNKHAEKVLFKFCQTKIKDIIKNNPDFKKETLSDDEIEALEFFELN